ncbi:hypothetical protein LJR071_003562 [Pseudomonas sp. LjRoot71]|uniref:hypothetical protein n=1 Tax=Pseudomonas sp. LjRoot71 TaxID=3342336 RepID=UPI003ED0EBD2
MANQLRKVPSVTFRPGTPAVPPTPAHCVQEPVYSDYGAYQLQLNYASWLAEKVNRAPLGSAYFGKLPGSNTYGWIVSTIDSGFMQAAGIGGVVGPLPILIGYRLVCYPGTKGTPGTPPKTSYSAETGWNSGAVSIGGFAADGYAEFVIGPGSIGVVVGLNTGPDTNSPSDCSHAFYGANGVLSIFERGSPVVTVPGGYASGPVLRIVRTAGSVSYFVNGERVHISALQSTGYARIDAALYVAGDFVDNPKVGAAQKGRASTSVGVTAFIDARLRASTRVGVAGSARGRAGSQYRSSANTRLGVAATAQGFANHRQQAESAVGVSGTARPAENKVIAIAPRFNVLAADASYAFAESNYAGGYRAESQGGFPTVEFSGAFTLMPPMQAFSYMLTGGVISVEAQGPKPVCICADYPYAQVDSSHGGGWDARSFEPWYAPDAIDIAEGVAIGARMAMFAAVEAVFSSVIQVGDLATIDVELLDGFEWFESILAHSGFLENSDRYAEFASALAVSTQSDAPMREGIQYATNVETGAITRYSGLGLMATVISHGSTYGVSDGGVYRLGDAGSPIDAFADFGASGYGTTQSKIVDALYFGLSTDGSVVAFLKADDGTEQAYQVVSREPMMRAITAKGRNARTWRLGLKVSEATRAELDAVEVSVGVSARRVR